MTGSRILVLTIALLVASGCGSKAEPAVKTYTPTAPAVVQTPAGQPVQVVDRGTSAEDADNASQVAIEQSGQ